MRWFLFIPILLSLGMFAQSTEQSISFDKQPFSIKKKASINVSEIEQDFFPSLMTIAPFPGGEGHMEHLQNIKQKIVYNKRSDNPLSKKMTQDAPILGESVEGNFPDGIPNDNYLAISNDGDIISVANSTIYLSSAGALDEEGSELSLAAFSSTLGEYNQAFDPKVLYDPNEDRFILMFLNGYTSFTADIVMAFSQSADPMGEWNLYTIPSSSPDSTSWSDYPMLAITEDEVFLTVNYIGNNQGWEEGFKSTIMWQIDKQSGYEGAEELNSVIWNQNTYNSNPIRNAIPVKGGSTLHGPNQYFLSNRNFDESNDTIFLIELTGTLDDEETTVNIEILTSDVLYGVPPNGKQNGTGKVLATNDGRILGAMYENDKIHFTSTTVVPESGTSGIYHGTITNLGTDSVRVSANIIGDTALYFAYPNLSYTGQVEGDDQFILTFEHTSKYVYPGISAIFYNQGEYSEIITVKEGDIAIGGSSPFGNNQRWGDYSGSQLKYDTPGEVWISGTYGRNPSVGSSGIRGTWIAQLSSPVDDYVPPADTMVIDTIPDTMTLDTTISTGISPLLKQHNKLYPNPAQDFFVTNFTLNKTSVIEAILYDGRGQQINRLLKKEVQAGEQAFKFATTDLPTGVYILHINSQEGIILSQKLVVE